MNKEELIKLLKSLKEECPRCITPADAGYNKAIDTSCSLIKAYGETK